VLRTGMLANGQIRHGLISGDGRPVMSGSVMEFTVVSGRCLPD